MPDNPRMTGHPSDMPSSRSSEASTGSAASGTPGSGSNASSAPPSGTSSGNMQTRNIIIGAIATIIASTSVYYLTQYINNRKSSETSATWLERKEATTNAWKRYVTMDNIYYNAVAILADDKTLLSDPDKYLTEISKESDIFKKDAGEIAKEKNVDAAFITMLTRRTDRQTEYLAMINSFVSKSKAIIASTTNETAQKKKILEAAPPLFASINRLYKKAANEIEELSKTLSSIYSVPFDPNEVKIYANYKKGISTPDNLDNERGDTTSYTANIEPRSLVGSWNDNGNQINLLKDNTFNSSLVVGDKATGNWKIENGKLRLDGVSSVNNQKTVWLFNIKNITPDSFTMSLSIKPFDTYNLVRVKNK